jgi:inhibitor of cysteine peptidase
MRKLLAIGLITLVCFTFCFAEGSRQPRVIKARLGQSFTITLKSNRTTGYEWQFAKPLDEGMIQLISSDYLPDKTGLIGAGGKQRWVFKAMKPGKTTLYFKYVRPWEKGNLPEGEESFLIVIVR